ncbi:MAG: signal peptidase I [Candidatus Colwellbacteria bacterium]|jgi:signal peptidase I|nr:signal peptidase I [Candidatus Colwellbacteria bacterium]MDD3752691.1 signal peptidase I [Candidatus Colwellbacteria bacterium]MDD4818840.1 signal peptidase I [Candidatus Colwellbacteria bacterium]
MKKIYLVIWEALEVILVAFLPLFVSYHFLARPFLVQGASMEPNFQTGNYLVVDIISYKFGNPERGDVVVFRYPGNRSLYYIKRVIGLPGERVTLMSGNIFINGEVLKENYIPSYVETDAFDETDFLLGEEEYFVMGDNRSSSFDSRSWGPLGKNDIVGVVKMRVWPPLEIYKDSQ